MSAQYYIFQKVGSIVLGFVSRQAITFESDEAALGKAEEFAKQMRADSPEGVNMGKVYVYRSDSLSTPLYEVEIPEKV